MISAERASWIAQQSGIKIDAFGVPVVDRFEYLVTFAQKVEAETETRLRALGFVAPVVPVKRGRGRPRKDAK